MATQQHDEQLMTLEQVEDHIKKANIDQYAQPQTGTRGAAGAESLDLAAQLKRICGIYRGIRPILAIVAGFFLLPASVRSAVKTFMTVMDGICPA